MSDEMNCSIDLTSVKRQALQLNDAVSVISSDNVLTLSRPFHCQQPFFYVIHEGHLWWGQYYVQLIKQMQLEGVPLKVNRDYIRDYLAYQAPLTWETLFAPIKFLRTGESHHLTVPEGHLYSCTFIPGNSDKPLTDKTFKQALEQQLEVLNPRSTVFHLSSGLDSSLLAILSARIHDPKAIQMASCITRGTGCTSELDVVYRLADDIGGNLRIYNLIDIDVFAVGKSLVNDCLGYPLTHSSHLVEYAMDRAIVSEGYQIIVNGKGPDDCLGGYASHLPIYANTYAHKKRLTVTDEPTLSELFGSGNSVAGQFWQTASSTLSLQERLYYDARALTDGWNVIHSSIAKHMDCKVKSPFMQHAIRMGLFALNDAERIVDIQQKVFMRRTFSDIYPDYLLNQPKAAFRLDLEPYFKEYNTATLLTKILGESGQTGLIVDINTVQRLIEQTLVGKRNYGWQLWSLYLVFCAIDAITIRQHCNTGSLAH